MRFLITGVCLLFSFGLCQSQTPFFQNFNLPNKNEPTDIHAILQGNDGFIWIGTNRGLFQFDGFSFTRYTTKDSLPSNVVTAIAQDSLGRIWMGHANGQLSFLEENKVVTFGPAEGSATAEISDIIFDSNGTLWFSTLNDGLYYYINERLYRLDEEDGMPDLYLYDLEKGNNGEIYVGSDGGLTICKLQRTKATLQVLNHKQGLPDNIVKKIKFINDKLIWLGTQDSGMIQYEPKQEKFTPLLIKWPFGSITDFAIKQNQVWVTNPQKEVVVINLQQPNKIQLVPTHDGNSKLLLDNENGIWIGKHVQLTRTPGTEFSFIEKFTKEANPNIIAITVDHEQNIWFANEDGLFKVWKIANQYKEIEKIDNSSLRDFPIISLHTDSLNRIWVGSFGKGALLMNMKGDVLHSFTKELKNGNVLSICSKRNTTWFATLEGTIQITNDDNQFIIKNIGTKEGLSSDYIYQVFVDSKGRAWFATDGYDIDMLDASGFHHYDLGGKSKVVYGFAEDKAGVIWANIQNEGVYRLGQTKFEHYTKLKANSIHGIASNAAGNIITIHDLGISVIDTERDDVYTFGEEVGIKNKNANLNAIAQNSAGEVFIGTNDGIILYEPTGKLQKKRPQPFIQKVKTGSLEFSNVNHLIIDYDHNDVTISYLGFWFENPQNLNYQYMLENFDRTWISSKNHEVTYSRLPAGEYIFHLRVSESENFNDAVERTIQFRVKPPFWQQPWFYLAIAAVVIYGLYWYIRFREEKLQRERYLLKLKVEERTAELQQRNEEVLAQSEEIHLQSAEIQRINNHLEDLVHERTAELEKKNKALEEYAFINAHKLRSPVASILGLVNLMLKSTASSELKEHTEHLEKSAKALDEIVRSITKAIEKADEK